MDGEFELGGRLFRLRRSRSSDVEQLLRYARDPNPRWVSMEYPGSSDRAGVVVAEMAKEWRGQFGLARFLVDARTDVIVAMVTLARHTASCVEVAYGVAPAERGQGVATALLRMVTEWTLANGVATRIEAVIDPTNAASIRVVTKVGFIYESGRTSVIERTGATYNDCVYVLCQAQAATTS